MKTLDQTQKPPITSPSGVILELRNVTKFYGDLMVLDDVSFRLLVGGTKIILGGSGSGKSTML